MIQVFKAQPFTHLILDNIQPSIMLFSLKAWRKRWRQRKLRSFYLLLFCTLEQTEEVSGYCPEDAHPADAHPAVLAKMIDYQQYFHQKHRYYHIWVCENLFYVSCIQKCGCTIYKKNREQPRVHGEYSHGTDWAVCSLQLVVLVWQSMWLNLLQRYNRGLPYSANNLSKAYGMLPALHEMTKIWSEQKAGEESRTFSKPTKRKVFLSWACGRIEDGWVSHGLTLRSLSDVHLINVFVGY